MEFLLNWTFLLPKNSVTEVVWHLCAGNGCGAGGAVFFFPPAPKFVHRVVADQVACFKCTESSKRSWCVP